MPPPLNLPNQGKRSLRRKRRRKPLVVIGFAELIAWLSDREKFRMAKRSNHTVGLDIGTSRVTCVIAAPGEEDVLQILGMGEAEARGLRKGVIVNPDAAIEAIKRAVEEAERMSGVQAEEVTINLAGSHIMGFNGQAIVAVAGGDGKIPTDDVRRAIDSACAIHLPAGREIVDRLPQEFIVDDQDGINDPVSMTGARLAVKVHIVTSPVTARQNAINAVNRAGLIVADMILEQLAAAEATLTDDDKEYGSALVDIGAETTGLCVYQRGAVQHTAVFPLGGSHLTNDIAFGLLDGMVEIAEQVFDAPVRVGYPERDRFGGLIEDIQSPAWAAAAGLALVSQRAHALEQRSGSAKRGGSGRLTHFVSKFRNRFSSSIF